MSDLIRILPHKIAPGDEAAEECYGNFFLLREKLVAVMRKAILLLVGFSI